MVGNRKLADVIRGHCLAIEFMGDLEEALSDTCHGNPPIS